MLRRPEINITSAPLRLRAIQNKMPSARLGLVVGKKGNATAVRRNRIKRIVREKFRLQDDLPCMDIVVQVFGPVADDVLAMKIEHLFDQLKQE